MTTPSADLVGGVGLLQGGVLLLGKTSIVERSGPPSGLMSWARVYIDRDTGAFYRNIGTADQPAWLPDTSLHSFVAGQGIQENTPVRIDNGTAFVAEQTNLSHASNFILWALSTALQGTRLVCMSSGVAKVSFTLSTGLVYLGIGVAQQTLPTSGILQVLGRAITVDQFFFSPETPIILGV